LLSREVAEVQSIKGAKLCSNKVESQALSLDIFRTKTKLVFAIELPKSATVWERWENEK